MKGHHKFLIPKFDNTQKHVRRWKCKVARPNFTTWQYYMSMESQHAMNGHLFYNMEINLIVNMVAMGDVVGEGKILFL